jgi:hypothetical protein
MVDGNSVKNEVKFVDANDGNVDLKSCSIQILIKLENWEVKKE